MNTLSILKATTLLASAAAFSLSASADTIGNFDGAGDTAVTFNSFGDPGGASIQTTGGTSGGYLRLTDAINGQNNYATFDRSNAGTYNSSNFKFQFKVETVATPSADGFSFSYADTTKFGSTGGISAAAFGGPEDPASVGVLGFGFDTWSNQGEFDNPAVPQSSDYSEISVFFNNKLVSRVDDTRSLTPKLTLDDGAWHDVTGTVDFAGAKVSLSVDGNAIFTGLDVPGLAPFESRVLLAGRTGGENERLYIDGLNVTYVPEPSSITLGLLGMLSLGFAMRRRS